MTQRRDDRLQELHRLLSAGSEAEAAALLAEARGAARARVRELLTEIYAEVLLERAAASLQPAEPAPAAEPAPVTRPAPVAEGAPHRSGGLGWYVYGVVAADRLQVVPDLPGIDGAHPVTTLRHGDVAAVVCRVALDEFGEAPLREHLGDMDWLERAARAHERVLDALLADETPIPMRLCSIYSDEQGLRAMLEREHDAYARALRDLRGSMEWGVKGFAEPDAVAADTAAGAGTSGGEGRAYMDGRLAERRRREEARQALDAACAAVHDALAAASGAATALPPHRAEVAGRSAPMVLNGAYLVARADADAFAARVEEVQARYAPLGLSLELSGPWPPYNFVPGTIGGAW